MAVSQTSSGMRALSPTELRDHVKFTFSVMAVSQTRSGMRALSTTEVEVMSSLPSQLWLYPRPGAEWEHCPLLRLKSCQVYLLSYGCIPDQEWNESVVHHWVVRSCKVYLLSYGCIPDQERNESIVHHWGWSHVKLTFSVMAVSQTRSGMRALSTTELWAHTVHLLSYGCIPDQERNESVVLHWVAGSYCLPSQLWL